MIHKDFETLYTVQIETNNMPRTLILDVIPISNDCLSILITDSNSPQTLFSVVTSPKAIANLCLEVMPDYRVK